MYLVVGSLTALAVVLLLVLWPGHGAPKDSPGQACADPPTGASRAYFAAGCFWGVEHTFAQVPGVLDAVSGYMGGHVDHPTYREVCGGGTGHAETVEVTFDPAVVSYGELLAAFFECHDPTLVNRQGPDVGTQYRSAIFAFDEGQLAEAREAAAEWSRSAYLRARHGDRPLATEIVPPGPRFWRAEDFHQDYHAKHGGACGVDF